MLTLRDLGGVGVAALCFSIPGHLIAQTTTDCSPIGSTVHCETRPTPPNLFTTLGNIAEAIARDQQVNAMQAAMRTTQQQDSASLLRAHIAVTEHQKAQWDAFAPRAQMVAARWQDSARLGVGHQDSLYWKDAADALVRLYTLEPLASNAAMEDAVEPVARQYRSRVDAFDRIAVQVFVALADSLKLSAAEQWTLTEDADPRLVILRDRDPSADLTTIRLMFQPGVDAILIQRQLHAMLPKSVPRTHRKPPTSRRSAARA